MLKQKEEIIINELIWEEEALKKINFISHTSRNRKNRKKLVTSVCELLEFLGPHLDEITMENHYLFQNAAAFYKNLKYPYQITYLNELEAKHILLYHSEQLDKVKYPVTDPYLNDFISHPIYQKYLQK